jgi:hypothetical protein
VLISAGTFTMSGGTISGNSITDGYGSGGGVYVSGTFTMSGGTISGNSCDFRGGGVQVSDGTFIKTGGTIYGSDAAASNRNRADKNGWGHAVYKSGYPSVKYRDDTAGPSVNINTDDGTGLSTGSAL